MQVIFYSTHCPRCTVLETKLKQKNIEYIEINDMDEILKLGVSSVPVLEVDGKLMLFKAANDWVNKQ